MLDKALHKAKLSLKAPKPGTGGCTEFRSNRVVPFVPCLEQQAKILRLLDSDMKFKYKNKISHYFTNNNSQKFNGGVYQIPCSDCPKIYIGETGRTLDTRISEHKRDILSQKPSSAIANHVSDKDHRINFHDSKLIFKSKNVIHRHLVESAFINLNSAISLNGNFGFSPHNKLLSKYICKSLNLT